MRITPLILDGYNGPIKQFTCRVCKHRFHLTMADYEQRPEVSYCFECNIILLEELEKNHVPQVAIFCRRLIEGLANTLYPARKEQVKGRDVGPEEYRNRLWAYVEERLDASKQARDLVQKSLQDLGSRIDKLDKLANKGLHASTTLLEIDRLLIALVTVAYDLLSVTPPPIEVPIEPHLPELYKLIEAIKEEGRNEEKSSS